MGLGAKPRRWAPLTRDTRKGIERVYLIFFEDQQLSKKRTLNYASARN